MIRLTRRSSSRLGYEAALRGPGEKKFHHPRSPELRSGAAAKFCGSFLEGGARGCSVDALVGQVVCLFVAGNVCVSSDPVDCQILKCGEELSGFLDDRLIGFCLPALGEYAVGVGGVGEEGNFFVFLSLPEAVLQAQF